MKIWDRISIGIATFLRGASVEEHVAAGQAAADLAKRWSHAFVVNPELACDIIRLSGILAIDPPLYDNVTGLLAPRDPYREFEQKGARDLALKLLAAGGMTLTEINELMETSE
ncbi:hypothetical protein [Pacificibacter marinus]|uniref:hypothetical protein n=1 Tax=Pacificibacter marinus TaxID=658057 RepID=UPI001C06A620|nr:hypothetical protein [Pacificibacter marinus]MBU2867019.1 hypothetical protein [Pacificibacter marinus]